MAKKKKKQEQKRFSFRELYRQGLQSQIRDMMTEKRPIGKGTGKRFIDVNT
jgi:hypothetical protein